MQKFILMIGIPGSGKSTHIKNDIIDITETSDEGLIYGVGKKDKEPFVVIGSDNIREANGYEPGAINDTFDKMMKYTRQSLSEGKSVIYDATNLSRKKRIGLLDQLKHFDCKKECIVFTTPYEICLERNKQRDEKWVVPDKAMDKMLRAFEIPMKTEGWNNITKYSAAKPIYTLEDLLKRTKGFNQENHHHALTLSEHLESTLDYVKRNEKNTITKNIIETAALYHDIGKLYTKDFHDSKGNETEIAHYYGHGNASTYLFLSAEKEMGLNTEWHIATLINWHMRPYDNLSEKTKAKDKALLGETMYEELNFLHEADLNAHQKQRELPYIDTFEAIEKMPTL